MKLTIALLIAFINVIPILGEPKETVSQKEIFVGDVFEFTILFEEKLPESIIYPTGDFIEEGEELPLFKVLSSAKKENSLVLRLRFYVPGEFIIPIEWNENSQTIKSKLKININSQLSGKETDIESNDPPFTFNGFYYHRLAFAILIFLILSYLLYASYIYWKKQNKIVNAVWEKIPELDQRTKKLILLEEFLNQDHIDYKDFCFIFSSYCKEDYSFRLNTNLLHLTDSNFLAYLYDHSGLEEPILREMRSIFRKAKYSEFSKQLTQEEAQFLWNDWKSKLKL
jgi:hypothetical protein